MKKILKHSTKKWEISRIELKNDKEKRFKVTRRYPDYSIAETKFFRSKDKAKKQFEKWLE